MEKKVTAEDILWWNLSPEELRFIRQSGNYITLEPGKVLFEKGELADGFYIIISGEVDICDKNEQGERIRLTTLSSGTVFGEIAAFTRHARTASAIAATTGIAFKIDQDFIQGVIEFRPKIATQILTNIITIMANCIVRLSGQVSTLKKSKEQ